VYIYVHQIFTNFYAQHQFPLCASCATFLHNIVSVSGRSDFNDLRPRRNNLMLTAKCLSITDRDFIITRIIFKSIYWSWHIPLLFTQMWLRYVRVFATANPSVVCSLSVCLYTLLRGLKLSAIFLHRCLTWPSSDFGAKFYGDLPRGTLPSDALNARGIAK